MQESADALMDYIDDAAARNSAGSAGRAISKRFDWDTINQGLLDRYLLIARRVPSKSR